MIIEGLIVSGIGALVSQLGKPRPIYGILAGWWKGAFTPDNAATGIANMIDSDFNCEWWDYEDIAWNNDGRRTDFYSRRFYSKHLKTGVLVPVTYEGSLSNDKLVRLVIEKKDGKLLSVPITHHSDYMLTRAIDRWNKRKKRLNKMKELHEGEDLINERVTKGYIDQVKMIEERILHREPETANELQATLMPPEHEPEVRKKVKKEYDGKRKTSTTKA